jgi:RNA polymerase sigma factor (TIGR02999 family)
VQGHAILIWESHRSLTFDGPIALGFDRWMSSLPKPDPTGLLQAWGKGDHAAFEELIPLVHEELRRVAQRELRRERPGHSLEATALVNEAYLRLIDLNRIEWHDRAHFFAMSARMMRRILVDSARARGNQKRGGGTPKVSLDEALQVSKEPGCDLVVLDDALKTLGAMDPRKAQVVEMRFFGGLTIEESAAALQVSVDTVRRDWRVAKVWLLRELSRGGADDA